MGQCLTHAPIIQDVTSIIHITAMHAMHAMQEQTGPGEHAAFADRPGADWP